MRKSKAVILALIILILTLFVNLNGPKNTSRLQLDETKIYTGNLIKNPKVNYTLTAPKIPDWYLGTAKGVISGFPESTINETVTNNLRQLSVSSEFFVSKSNNNDSFNTHLKSKGKDWVILLSQVVKVTKNTEYTLVLDVSSKDSTRLHNSVYGGEGKRSGFDDINSRNSESINGDEKIHLIFNSRDNEYVTINSRHYANATKDSSINFKHIGLYETEDYINQRLAEITESNNSERLNLNLDLNYIKDELEKLETILNGRHHSENSDPTPLPDSIKQMVSKFDSHIEAFENISSTKPTILPTRDKEGLIEIALGNPNRNYQFKLPVLDDNDYYSRVYDDNQKGYIYTVENNQITKGLEFFAEAPNIIYVGGDSLGGNNSNSGSFNYPVRTIKKALELITDKGTIVLKSSWNLNKDISTIEIDNGKDITFTSSNVDIEKGGLTEANTLSRTWSEDVPGVKVPMITPIFDIKGNAKLTLMNIILNDDSYPGKDKDTMISVKSGTIVINDGTTIKNGNRGGNGGSAILIYGDDSNKLFMNGGLIQGNSSTDQASAIGVINSDTVQHELHFYGGIITGNISQSRTVTINNNSKYYFGGDFKLYENQDNLGIILTPNQDKYIREDFTGILDVSDKRPELFNSSTGFKLVDNQGKLIVPDEFHIIEGIKLKENNFLFATYKDGKYVWDYKYDNNFEIKTTPTDENTGVILRRAIIGLDSNNNIQYSDTYFIEKEIPKLSSIDYFVTINKELGEVKYLLKDENNVEITISYDEFISKYTNELNKITEDIILTIDEQNLLDNMITELKNKNTVEDIFNLIESFQDKVTNNQELKDYANSNLDIPLTEENKNLVDSLIKDMIDGQKTLEAAKEVIDYQKRLIEEIELGKQELDAFLETFTNPTEEIKQIIQAAKDSLTTSKTLEDVINIIKEAKNTVNDELYLTKTMDDLRIYLEDYIEYVTGDKEYLEDLINTLVNEVNKENFNDLLKLVTDGKEKLLIKEQEMTSNSLDEFYSEIDEHYKEYFTEYINIAKEQFKQEENINTLKPLLDIYKESINLEIEKLVLIDAKTEAKRIIESYTKSLFGDLLNDYLSIYNDQIDGAENEEKVLDLISKYIEITEKLDDLVQIAKDLYGDILEDSAETLVKDILTKLLDENQEYYFEEAMIDIFKTYKEDKMTNLDEYINPNDSEVIKGIVSNSKNKIDASFSKDEIDFTIIEAKKEIDRQRLLEESIISGKNNLRDFLSDQEELSIEVERIINDAINSLEKAKTIDEVLQIVENSILEANRQIVLDKIKSTKLNLEESLKDYIKDIVGDNTNLNDIIDDLVNNINKDNYLDLESHIFDGKEKLLKSEKNRIKEALNDVYSTLLPEEQLIVEQYINDAIDNIDNETDINLINSIKNETLLSISKALYDEKLKDEKEEAKKVLENYVNDKFDDLLDEYLESYLEKIEAAPTVEEVLDLLNESLETLLGLEDIVTLAKDLYGDSLIGEYYELLKEVLNDIVDINSDYSIEDGINKILSLYKENSKDKLDLYTKDDNSVNIDNIVLNSKSLIEKSTSKDEIDKIITNSKILIDEQRTLDVEILYAKKELDDFINEFNDISEEIQSIVKENKEALDNANSSQEIEEILKNAKEDILLTKKEETLRKDKVDALKEISDFVDVDSSDTIKDILNEIQEKINSANDKNEIIQILSDGLKAINDQIRLENLVDEIKTDNYNANDYANNQVIDLYGKVKNNNGIDKNNKLIVKNVEIIKNNIDKITNSINLNNLKFINNTLSKNDLTNKLIFGQLEISLVDQNNQNIDKGLYEGTYEVSFLIPESFRAYNNLIVIYLNETTNELEVFRTTTKDFWITFDTDHFSTFYLIGEPAESTLNLWYLIVILILIIIIELIVIFFKKKNLNSDVRTNSFLLPIFLAFIPINADIYIGILILIVLLLLVYVIYLFVKGNMNQRTNNFTDKSIIVHNESLDNEKLDDELKGNTLNTSGNQAIDRTIFNYSFTSRLHLNDVDTDKRYNLIKNYLLSFDGISSNISWKQETFIFKGSLVAKIRINGKTIRVYLAVDPKTLDSKYNVTDVSHIKTQESTPSLQIIKGPLKSRHTTEIIDIIMKNNKIDKDPLFEEKDYTLVKISKDKLIEQNLIKIQDGSFIKNNK